MLHSSENTLILEICHIDIPSMLYLILIVLNDEPFDCISTSEICALRYFGHFACARDSVKRRIVSLTATDHTYVHSYARF